MLSLLIVVDNFLTTLPIFLPVVVTTEMSGATALATFSVAADVGATTTMRFRRSCFLPR